MDIKRLNLVPMTGVERVLELSKKSDNFRLCFYVHVTGARKTLLIESSKPLRILECFDGFRSDLRLDSKRGPWTVAVKAHRLFDLWTPERTFGVCFLSTRVYEDILKATHGHTCPEVLVEAKNLAFKITDEFHIALLQKEIVEDFELYKEKVRTGERDAEEDIRSAALDRTIVFRNNKGELDPRVDAARKLEKAYCAQMSRQAADVKTFGALIDILNNRANLKCIMGFAEYARQYPATQKDTVNAS